MFNFKEFFHNWSWVILFAFCIAGLFFPAVGVIAVICMLAPVIVSFFNGRFWCGNFCPRGSMNDIIISKISRRLRIPGLLKKQWFKLLILVLLMGGFAIQIHFAWGSINAVGMVFVRMILITTIIAIILGTIYNQRTWCTICPMGTMASYVARSKFVSKRAKHVQFKAQKCVNCKVCSNKCPMGIDVLGHKNIGRVTHPDCIKCEVCINKCPKKSLYI